MSYLVRDLCKNDYTDHELYTYLTPKMYEYIDCDSTDTIMRLGWDDCQCLSHDSNEPVPYPEDVCIPYPPHLITHPIIKKIVFVI